MIERYKDIARGLVVVLGLAMLGSAARAEQPFILQDFESNVGDAQRRGSKRCATSPSRSAECSRRATGRRR